jgi:hypothetical protein
MEGEASTIKGNIFSLYVRYLTLLHLPPLRFYLVGGRWNRTLDCGDFGIDAAIRSNHYRQDLILSLAGSHTNRLQQFTIPAINVIGTVSTHVQDPVNYRQGGGSCLLEDSVYFCMTGVLSARRTLRTTEYIYVE